MVKETRQVFDLSDIKAVRLQCNSCKGELVIELDKAKIPVNCPHPGCEQRWTAQNSTSSESAGVIESLRRLLRFPDDKMTLRFEIEGEADK